MSYSLSALLNIFKNNLFEYLLTNKRTRRGIIMFKLIKQFTSFVAMVAVLFAFTTETMAAKKSKTLKNTQKKGFVRCGVSQGLPGFSNADASGNWTGVDVDVCRAVAAAVLGCLLYTSPSPRDNTTSRMPSSA